MSKVNDRLKNILTRKCLECNERLTFLRHSAIEKFQARIHWFNFWRFAFAKGADLQNSVTCVWKEPGVIKQYRTAVSLHGHTSHSHESLSFISQIAGRFLPLRWLIAQYEVRARKTSGVCVDLNKGYWTPPLPPLAAFEVERDQIERELDMPALVSLSDHDNIEAPMLLRVIPESRHIPISLEWSVPYRDTVLHLGVHNLPSAEAQAIVDDLNAFTAAPKDGRLRDLLMLLNRMPEVLIVLNHPMWDLPGIGKVRHVHSLTAFVAEFGTYLHAFELGGLRSWEENQQVVEFAHGWNQLVIAGGDRHGSEPSAVISLSEAECFSEFVHEVRKERRSNVLFMPQYKEPLALRIALSVLDILRDYPDYSAGSRRWDERVFHPNNVGEGRPLAAMWHTPPAFIDWFVKAVHLLESPPVRHGMRLLLGTPSQEPRLVLGESQEEALP